MDKQQKVMLYKNSKIIYSSPGDFSLLRITKGNNITIQNISLHKNINTCERFLNDRFRTKIITDSLLNCFLSAPHAWQVQYQPIYIIHKYS